LQSPARFRVVVAGRRSGKTTMLREMAVATAARGKTVWYVSTTWQQVRTNFWEPLLYDYRPALDDVHLAGYRCKIGSGRIECRSAERPENIRGAGVDLVLLDEYQDMSHALWGVVEPILLESRGRAVIAGTPMGVGSHFHELFSLDRPDWAHWHLTSYDATHLDRAELDARRADAEARGPMHLRVWRREYMADWDAFVGQIFEAWDASVHVVDHEVARPEHSVIGVDWGFSESHPGAVEVLTQVGERWTVAQEIVATGKTIEAWWVPRIVEAQRRWDARAIWCDPARPDAIAALRRGGAHGVREAKNSVLDGIITIATLLERDALRVHSSCRLLRAQMPGYRWESQRDGTLREKPRKAQDDAIDALRYALHSELTLPRPWAR
jgi:hypothetical protein